MVAGRQVERVHPHRRHVGGEFGKRGGAREEHCSDPCAAYAGSFRDRVGGSGQGGTGRDDDRGAGQEREDLWQHPVPTAESNLCPWLRPHDRCLERRRPRADLILGQRTMTVHHD